MQILVVDDDDELGELLVTSLRRAGHEVRRAADGDEGWRTWQQERQRLVVTDWLMPGLDGPALIARLRAASTGRYTYIVLLTVKREKEDVVKGLRAGADDYLTKPFHTGELLARVAIGERILSLESQLSDTIAQLERQTKYDDLTGVLNRRRLLELAQQEFDHSLRYGRALTAIMLDIDHFKQINDVHGHAVGDQVLRVVAERCRRNMRVVDILGRYGGEEFAAVMPETDLAAALPAAERLRESVGDIPVPTTHGPLGITISLGLACLHDGAADIAFLLDQADSAMYAAKRAGRNQVRVAARPEPAAKVLAL